MTTRAADATIKGYYYQFDTSILQLLELTDESHKITVEGIEDIDIETATDQTAIQCKYLSKPKFINSAVREPITLMLDHFVSNGKKWKYVLYAHFENETGGAVKNLTLADLKDILTYTENKKPKCHYRDNGITDMQLTDFLTDFKLMFGKEFGVQQSEVIKKLKNVFNCTDFEADALYYNNGLRLIIDKAKESNIQDRCITLGEFKKGVDTKQILFNIWYIKLRSKKEYLKNLKTAISNTNATANNKIKYISIGKSILSADNNDYTLLTFIEHLLYKFYRMNHSLRNSKPLTLILDVTETERLGIKKLLISNDIAFNDGHEEIEFNNKVFNAEPVVNVGSNLNKLAKSSFFIKIVSASTFVKHIDDLTKPKVIFHFSEDNCPYLNSMEYQIYDIKYCDSLKDIASIII